jgi:signal transduction histidine kinase/ligand-binding sensor domain-containing protein
VFLSRFLSRFLTLLCYAAALGGLACTPARAGEAGAALERPSLLDYQHTAWSVTDGAPPRILGMAQSADGWLWLASADGLYRFDGMRFERFPLPPRGGMNRDRISDIYAAPNGDLFIAYFGEGVSVLHPDGRIDDLPPQPRLKNSVGSMAIDADGSLWTQGGTMQRFRGGRWDVMAEGPEWTSNEGGSMLVDGSGRLWVANQTSVYRFDRAAQQLVRVGAGGGELLLGPDGRVWMTDGARALRLLAGPDGARPAAYVQGASRWAGLFDQAGTLWLLACPQPLCLMPAPAPQQAQDGRMRLRAPDAAAHATAPLQVTGSDAYLILADREGDIWVATQNGLDRYRRKRFQRTGLQGAGTLYSMGADGEGRMWAADRATGVLWRLRPDAAPEAAGRGVELVARGRDGALLVGRKRRIERRTRAGTEVVELPPGPDGKPRDHHMLGILDDGRVLWTATLETGLIGWRDGRWQGPRAFNLPAKIYQSAPAGPGQLWLATGDGELVFYDKDRLTTYDIRAAGLAAAIFPGAPLAVSGSAGFGVLDRGRLRLLHAREPEVLRNVSGMVVTPEGDRWLNGAAGLVHVRAADWRRSVADPAQPLRYEWFGAADGYPGQAVIETRWPSAMSADGRNLWLVGTGGMVRLDTGALRRQQAAPRAMILGVGAGDGPLAAARQAMVLPPGSRQLRFEYTAPALHMPERLRFEYRLDGVDGDWQDAGARRATSYNNVGPGDYVFRLRAINQDGIAAMTEAALRLRVQPTPLQTVWFKLACAGALALLAALLYRYRVRYVTQRLTERLQVRTAERERIARTLHDTFLQTVHGLVLRVDAVAAGLPPGDGARARLERVLDDASRALGEGREQLQELRAGDAHVLEDVVAETVARLRAMHGPIAVELRVEGERQALAPAVADDVAEIAREALRNAFAHSRALQIRVAIDYGRRTLRLRVADDGRGLDEAVRRAGARSGHWGLVGMRERAARIGAALALEGGLRQGTTVTLEVPAARAYAA